jgi:UDP-N-acetylmuramate--alanine ligase
MKLEEVHNVYFLGIGGIGMSAIARWFNHRGATVAGYDRVSTRLTKELESEGISIHYDDMVDQIPVWAFDKEKSLIVYTPAIPKDHQQYNYLQEQGMSIMKRSEVLGLITSGHYTLAIAGTHGKTTTSSMVAHILNGSEKGCSAFVGGIMTNYASNLIVGEEEAPVVVEADEFDRSFMRLHPDFAVVTSIDPDHLDIYGDSGEMRETYISFMKLTDDNGKILLHEDVAEQVGNKLARGFSTYGLHSSKIMATNLHAEDHKFVFDYEGEAIIKGIRLSLPGYHNMLNATAAITAGLHMGMTPEVIKERVESYRGVKRRFEYILNTSELVYIDDYAHHPSEIEALLTSVKKLYRGKKITTIFQPHLFSRTKDFNEGFAKSLSLSDEVILLDIYPARELPMEGVTSKIIYDLVTAPVKSMASKEDFPGRLESIQTDILLTVGAGDIDTIVPEIQYYYQQTENA